MSQSSNKNLQFSINESVWLRNGKEAEDVLSMALEPDITIEENPHYVSIKGALRLSGEFTTNEAGSGGLDGGNRPDFRLVDDLRETNDGTIMLEHHFPVDITIPANRVDDVDDLYVSVEAFDYNLPEKGCIQLEADVLITGLVDPTENEAPKSEARIVDESEIEEEVEEEEEEEVEVEEVFDPTESLEFESYREPEDQAPSEVSDTPDIELNQREEEDKSEEPEPTPSIPFEAEDESFNFEREEEEQEEEVVQSTPTPTFRAQDHFLSEKESTDQEQETDFENEREVIDTEAFFDEEEEPVEVVEEETTYQTKKRSENALYLTKMLTNEEDQFSKVRMCIVQNGDSLETISDRYEVPITSLLRRNRLDSDALEEGQILYIPVARK